MARRQPVPAVAQASWPADGVSRGPSEDTSRTEVKPEAAERPRRSSRRSGTAQEATHGVQRLRVLQGVSPNQPRPVTPEEQGTRFFLGGHMGDRIGERVDGYAAKAGMSRRNFLGRLGFSAAMLAANEDHRHEVLRGRRGRGRRPAAPRRGHPGRARRAATSSSTSTRTSVRGRAATSRGSNTTERGMWFVQLLDDLGKAFGLPNGTAT